MRQIDIGQLHKTKKLNDRGSAMLVALVVSVVVIGFCLSLLLVSYALYASSVRKVTRDQCHELAKSISLELEKELTGPAYISFEDQKQAFEDNKDRLWQYIRYNIGQTDWPYYDSERDGHKEEDAWRYFTLEIKEEDPNRYAPMASEVSVCVYWEKDAENQVLDAGGNQIADQMEDGDILCVKVSCYKGKQEVSMISRYALVCSKYDDEVQDGEQQETTMKEETDNTKKDNINPSGYSIQTSDCWTWSLLERE